MNISNKPRKRITSKNNFLRAKEVEFQTYIEVGKKKATF